jgi:CBS domain-containing protein
MIEHPIKVGSVMTSPVFTTTDEGLLYDTAKIMLQNVYTHVPVYKDGAFMGVLSESAILKWVGNRAKDNKQSKLDRKIGEMIDWLDASGNKFNDYEFVPRTMVILDVRKRFESALQEGRRLGAVFVTKTGKSSEKIEGIITAWDLPRLQLD